VLDVGAPGDAIAGERLDGRRIFIEHHALVAAARQAANDIPAHTPQADHSELHSFTPVIGLCRKAPQGHRAAFKMHPRHRPVTLRSHLENRALPKTSDCIALSAKPGG
jgi:hypothetical protein